jgi:ribosome biogenesis GTPase A
LHGDITPSAQILDPSGFGERARVRHVPGSSFALSTLAMSLQWYPGHMTKARRELAARMPSQDVVIEVLDARLPGSSANPLIAQLRGGKPCIKVLTKSDLADPVVTEAWLKYYRSQPNVQVFAAALGRPAETRARVRELSRGLAAHRGPDKAVRALIAGVPNVGKSSLINVLMQRTVAAVSDRPAVTKQQQSVVLKDGMTLTDSPGILWPKIEDEQGAFRLALAGSIPDTAIDTLTIGMFGAQYFLDQYAALITARFQLSSVPSSAEGLLELIGRRRGALGPGGIVVVHRAAEILINDFGAGTLGRISLERPPITGS